MKQNTSKKKKWILYIFITLIVLYFFIKSILIIRYNYEFNSLKKAVVEERNLTSIVLNEELYYTFKNISIKNNFRNYELNQSTEDVISFKSSENENKHFGIMLSVVDFIEMMNKSDSYFYKNVKNNGLHNEFDMCKKLYNNEKIRLVSHFDSLKKILYLNSYLPIEDFQVVSKNYKITFGNVGNMEYLLTDYNNRIFILLYKDGKVQCQLFFDNYEDKEIFELLSTIKID